MKKIVTFFNCIIDLIKFELELNFGDETAVLDEIPRDGYDG